MCTDIKNLLPFLPRALPLLRDVCGDFAERGTGIVFTLPIDEFHGPSVE